MIRFRQAARTGAVVVLAAGACRGGQGTTAPPAAAPAPAVAQARFEAGEPLPPGSVVGRVCKLAGAGFEAAGDVAVSLDDAEPAVRTDAAGFYGLERVRPGLHRVAVRAPGMWPMTLAFRLGSAAGAGRLNLALVPREAPGQTSDIVLAGVAVDPRGCALPGATVRIADSLTEVGNMSTQADVGGFWAVTLPAVRQGPWTSGVAGLTVHGRTAGGVAVEAMEVLSLSLGDAPSLSVVAGTRAFAVPTGLRWEGTGPRSGWLQAQGLPRRRDELVIRLDAEAGPHEVLPTSVGADGASVEWPAGISPSRLELLPLGLVPGSGEAPGLAVGP
ncbi:MAG: hypothetical protein VKQ33_04110 [Candidatus Sericytochromatia bacterium]|nr:hypothetical protein [Candidatus Sericytochromatia bacterium]